MNSYEYQKLRGLKRKVYLIDLRGGFCERCKYNKNISALDFHHKDPSAKDGQLDMRTLSNSTMEWIMKEFEKCEILCANCHRECHSPELTFENIRTVIRQIDEDVLIVKNIIKPQCLDCKTEINYSYLRCRTCANKKRKKNCPDSILFRQEFDEYGVTWCSKKYKIAKRTAHKWRQNV
jgi:hypothetical protein